MRFLSLFLENMKSEKTVGKCQKEAYNVTQQITKEAEPCLQISFLATFTFLFWAARLL